MAIVFYVVLFIFNYHDFAWKKSLFDVFIYTIVFVLVYSVAAALTPNRSNPLLLASDLERKISSEFTNLKIGDRGGLYLISKVDTEKMNFTYSPITNYKEIIVKIDSYINILNVIKSKSAYDLIDKLMIYKKEAEYMEVNELSSFDKSIIS
jgi:hypothetical protein